ncbi:MAG: PaaI family thioesterase [Anaerolineales bacterium]|nr:MAG: PaaI family thioesterase [Anaerolineales bacterium]
MKTNPAYITELIQFVNRSPFPMHLPFRLVSIEPDRARIELEIAASHLQPFGMVHGGVIATLIDTATFWAAFLNLPQEYGLVNVDLKLNYLRSPDSGKLFALGRCLKNGRTLSYAEASVTDAQGTLLAHGTSTLMVMPGKGLDIGVPKFLD